MAGLVLLLAIVVAWYLACALIDALPPPPRPSARAWILRAVVTLIALLIVVDRFVYDVF
jgi:hypothetical protein